jgi:NAD-dependent DNA ligase
VLEAEARALLHKLNTVEHVSSSSKFQKLSDILLKCLADNVLTLAEGEEIADWVARLVGDSFADTGLPSFGVSIQPENIIHDESLVQIKEKRFVLTGTLRQAPRHEVIKLIVVNGGQVSSAPSMKVDYIVIATNLSRDWKYTSFGGKIEKANALIEKGSKLVFISEYAFEKALSKLSG